MVVWSGTDGRVWEVRSVFERKRKRRKEERSEMAGQEGESEIFWEKGSGEELKG